MVRNTIQMMERVAALIDRTKSPRFKDQNYIDALNEATEEIVNEYVDPLKDAEKWSFQYAERVRADLADLIGSPATGALVAGVVPLPANYKYVALLYCTIGGVQVYARPIKYSQEGELQQDPFAKPTDSQIYFNEYSGGLRILNGPTAPSGYTLWYINTPNQLTIGNDNNKLITGASLTNGVLYYAYDQTVYGGVTYYPGDSITGATASNPLTSGTVILQSAVVNSELNELCDKICKLAASIMDGIAREWNGKQLLDRDVKNM